MSRSPTGLRSLGVPCSVCRVPYLLPPPNLLWLLHLSCSHSKAALQADGTARSGLGREPWGRGLALVWVLFLPGPGDAAAACQAVSGLCTQRSGPPSLGSSLSVGGGHTGPQHSRRLSASVSVVSPATHPSFSVGTSGLPAILAPVSRSPLRQVCPSPGVAPPGLVLLPILGPPQLHPVGKWGPWG